MKNVLLLMLTCLYFQMGVSQPPQFLVDNWYLHSFSFHTGEVFINTLGVTQGPTMIIENDFTLHGTSFCNPYNGEFEYIDNFPFGIHDNFIGRNFIRGTENCGDLEEIESHFFLPYLNEYTGEIYVITQSGDQKHIVLQFNSGYQVYKNFPALSLPHLSIKDMVIFPNPARDRLIIHSPINDFTSVSILDMQGRIVMNSDINNFKEIDVSSLTPGMYFLRIESIMGNISKKFIKG